MIGNISGTVDFAYKNSPVQMADKNTADQEKGTVVGGMPEIRSVTEQVRASNDLSEKKGEEKKEFDEKDAEELSDAMNKFMEKMNYDIRFNYRKELGRLTMRVVDRKTDEVIKEYPPEEMVKTLINIKEWIGVFLDKKV